MSKRDEIIRGCTSKVVMISGFEGYTWSICIALIEMLSAHSCDKSETRLERPSPCAPRVTRSASKEDVAIVHGRE
jgi:hypothetical protein